MLLETVQEIMGRGCLLVLSLALLGLFHGIYLP
jgi:hypothetical protein